MAETRKLHLLRNESTIACFQKLKHTWKKMKEFVENRNYFWNALFKRKPRNIIMTIYLIGFELLEKLLHLLMNCQNLE